MSNFQLDGYGNMINIFRKMPEDGYRKPVIAAFKKAAIPVRNAMIENLPSNLKKLRRVIRIKPGKGKSMTLAVGAYANAAMYRNRRGINWDPYMLLYWHNYGTLSNRAAEHSFKNPVRKISAGRRGGIRAGLFFERAVEQSMPQAEKDFEKAYKDEHMRFLNKEAAKW
jgi:hypothetical protein